MILEYPIVPFLLFEMKSELAEMPKYIPVGVAEAGGRETEI
jgi:hypothetical protein